MNENTQNTESRQPIHSSAYKFFKTPLRGALTLGTIATATCVYVAATNPEFKQMPLESMLTGSALFIGMQMGVGAAMGYVIPKVEHASIRLSQRVHSYFNK